MTSRLTTATTKQAGTITLVDLAALSEYYGHDTSPYPLPRGDHSIFANYHEYQTYARSVPDRLLHGDLAPLREWADVTLGNADITVACRIDNAATSLDIIATRAGHAGYLAYRKTSEPNLHVVKLDPLRLGEAVTRLAKLNRPGTRFRVAMTARAANPQEPERETDVATEIRDQVAPAAQALPLIRAEGVTGSGALQTSWKPRTEWSFDFDKPIIRWYYTDGGDYLVTDDKDIATPVNHAQLCDRINRSIAQDIAVIKRNRGDARG